MLKDTKNTGRKGASFGKRSNFKNLPHSTLLYQTTVITY
jgi:hypothetical protein